MLVVGQPRSSAVMVLLVAAVVALSVSQGLAVKVGFVSDSGTGHSNPAKPFIDWQGKWQNQYILNGEQCVDFAGEPCLLQSEATRVFDMLKRNGVDLVVHAGDLDYESAPRTFHNFLEDNLNGMDILAVKGNHDSNCDEGNGDPHGCIDNNNIDSWQGGLWDGKIGYDHYLRKHHPAKARCYGKYGVDYACDYGSLFFVFSSVGVERKGESANRQHAAFIRQALERSSAQWKVCVWHMTMADMQVSYKGDSTGWEVYEICREYGALIVTGHAHAYSRSYEMKRFAKPRYGHYERNLQVGNFAYEKINLHNGGPEQGSTAVAVVGTGGYKNEPQKRTGRHWAKIYAANCMQSQCFEAKDDSTSKFGALICDFPDDPSKNWANCQFKTTGRGDWSLDSFTLITKLKHVSKPSGALASEDFTSGGKVRAHGNRSTTPENAGGLLAGTPATETNVSTVANATTPGLLRGVKQVNKNKSKKVNSLGSSDP